MQPRRATPLPACLRTRKIVAGTDFPTYCYWAAAQVFHREGRAAEAARALEKVVV